MCYVYLTGMGLYFISTVDIQDNLGFVFCGTMDQCLDYLRKQDPERVIGRVYNPTPSEQAYARTADPSGLMTE